MSDQNIVKALFATPDGQYFETRQEAVDHIRIPQIKAALMAVTNGNEKVTNWLIEQQEAIVNAFDTGTIRRVSKKEKKALELALEAIKDVVGAEFLVENAKVVLDSFRWPAVKRMTDIEKEGAAKLSLLMVTENDQEMSDWIYKHREAILEGFEAGKVKRQISDKAKEALEAYRAKKAAEKAMLEETEE